MPTSSGRADAVPVVVTMAPLADAAPIAAFAATSLIAPVRIAIPLRPSLRRPLPREYSDGLRKGKLPPQVNDLKTTLGGNPIRAGCRWPPGHQSGLDKDTGRIP